MKLRMLALATSLALTVALVPASGALAHDDEEGDEFVGVIESLPATAGFIGDWLVSGVKVHVTADTEIEEEDGVVAIGATVEVEGTTEADGSITADEIEVEEKAEDDEFGQIEFEGIVQSLPAAGGLIGDWVVSGLIVHVTTATEIEGEDGTIAVGAMVKVEGLLGLDGSVTAHQIETENEGDFEDGSCSLQGVVQHLPKTHGRVGDWRVSNQTVHVKNGTKIVRNGHRLARGADVRVLGTRLKNGSIRATKVVVRG